MDKKVTSVWPQYSKNEIGAAMQVLESGRVNYWTGSAGRQFEEEFAEWSESKYAIAVTNGSVAIQIALHALGIGSGDDVVVPCRTFIATASCVSLSGARPVFADVDFESQNVTAETIKRVLTPKTRAVICVHLAGWPCEMEEIVKLARNRGIFVIEDCAQAHGARYKNRSVGSIGDIAAWSFCQDKIMTTGGEGGMVTTSDPELYKRAWSFKDHGKNPEKLNHKTNNGQFRWVHDSIGSNYRLTEFQSAIGLVQLEMVDQWHKERLDNAINIWSEASKYPVFRVPELPVHIDHACYRCYIFINEQYISVDWSLSRIISFLRENGVQCSNGICPEIYLENAYKDSSSAPVEYFPTARNLGDTGIQFLVHPTLSKAEINNICNKLQKLANILLKQ